MSEETWTFIRTIGAVLIGSALAIVGQRLEWGRQQRIRWDSRRSEVYGKYIGSCNAYFIALCEVRRAVHHDQAKLDDASRTSEHLRTEVAVVTGQLDMLAGRATRTASDALQENLGDLNVVLYDTIRGRKSKDDLPRTESLRRTTGRF